MAFEDKYGNGITLYGLGRYGGFGSMMPRKATANVESNKATVNIESNKASSITYRL